MKQTLQLRLGQQLTMTPQLQQAIRLLQLSTLELQSEIQEALDSNLMLEIAEDDGGNTAAEEQQARDDRDSSDDIAVLSDDRPINDNQEIPEDLPVDSSWDDIYDVPVSTSGPTDADQREFEYQGTSTESLADHLRWQMEMTNFSETDTQIALAIIDSISDDGYLETTIEDIHAGLPESLGVELDEVEAVLHRIQNFDPAGVGARDLSECLLIQLNQFPHETPYLELTKYLVREHLNLLASHDYNQLIRKMRISESDLQQMIMFIQSLNPRPGGQIQAGEPEYVIPDVFVKKYKGRWLVELNPDSAPRIRINQHYVNLIQRADNSQDNTVLKNHLQEARWFLKSLQSRNETLLKVASRIVDHQQGFLEHGDVAMKPLVLHDVAKAVEMHESTISRVTTRKYMHTPRGIFELKYFFSSHVGTKSGGECSSTAIRAIIKQLVDAENPVKPLSDSKIASVLSEQGVNVARRTVAKYREAMSIPSSNERKRLA